jgi:glycosyltransferase involved in cell wall biosynthesis
MGRIRTVVTALFVKKIIVSNNSDKQALPSLLFKKKIVVIPIGSNIKKAPKNPATLASLVGKHNLSKTLPTVVYFGFTNQAKGVLLLAESAANIKANVLLITELNPSNAYQKQVLSAVEKAKKDGASVAVTGYLSDTEVSEVLQESTLFVLPQPLPLTAKSGTTIAAVQHNAVVISTASLNAELNLPYINGNNAVLLSNAESSALASTINSVLDSPAQLQTIKDNLPALQSYFSWNNIADEHVRLYDRLD